MQLTVKDVAKTLNVAEKTVYRWIQSGGLPAYRVAGQYRINRAMLFEWANANKVNFFAEEEATRDEDAQLPTLSASLRAGGIHYRVDGTDTQQVFRSMVKLMELPDQVDRHFLYQALLARETLQSTGVGDGIAFPHVRNPAILDLQRPTIHLCFLENSIEFKALDGRPVRVLFTLLSPNVRIHLHLLSRLSFALRDEAFKVLLQQEPGRETLYEAIEKLEESGEESLPS